MTDDTQSLLSGALNQIPASGGEGAEQIVQRIKEACAQVADRAAEKLEAKCSDLFKQRGEFEARAARDEAYDIAESIRALIPTKPEGQATRRLTPGEVSTDFHAYWDAHQKDPAHGLITENAANATWHAAYTKYVAPEGQASGVREALERIIIDAMGWHPSENGPSYGKTQKELLERLFALASGKDAGSAAVSEPQASSGEGVRAALKPGEILGIEPNAARDLAERCIPETFQAELRALRAFAADDETKS